MTALMKDNGKDCGCGCGGAKSECCELECLVQPRFFCGQLLADQDLTALVDWVKAKSALSRHRHGWGVVCGLDVHCGKRGMVSITPGYALDCCGRDIVVCKEAEFDLTTCWKRPNDPCADISSQRRNERAAFPGGGSSNTIRFGTLDVPVAEVQAFDLYIRYSESLTDPRGALARGGCGTSPGCEYTRIEEGHDFYCKPVDDVLCDGIAAPRSDPYEQSYRSGLHEVLTRLDSIEKIGDARQRLNALISYVHEHRPPTFCFVHESLCALQAKPDLGGEWFEEASFWIVQDWRNAFFREDCHTCNSESGVQLARIWVWGRRVNGKEQFSILHVVPYAPFRRELSKDDDVAPAHAISVAPYIWQPLPRVQAKLSALGFRSLQQIEVTPEYFSRNVYPALDSLYIRRDAPELAVYWTSDRCVDQRVVRFGLPPRDGGGTGTVVVKPERTAARRRR